MACSRCACIPVEVSGGFIAKAVFEAAESFAKEQVASGAWTPLPSRTGFESVFVCSECGAIFELVMPDPPAPGGLLRISKTQQRIDELRNKRAKL